MYPIRVKPQLELLAVYAPPAPDKLQCSIGGAFSRMSEVSRGVEVLCVRPNAVTGD